MVVAVVLANVANFFLCWLLVFGDRRLGVPALGVSGAAWAGTLSTVFQLGVLLMAARRHPVESSPKAVRSPEPALMLRAFALGGPIGLQMLAEFGVFGIVQVLVGNMGSLALAGHQVAITFASATFMVPVGIGAAASVRVGQAVGRGDPRATRHAATSVSSPAWGSWRFRRSRSCSCHVRLRA